MREAIIKVLPILFFIIFGKFIKSKGWLKNETEGQLKLGVINIALPVILFITFKNLELKPESFAVTFVVFVMLNCFYLIGTVINRVFKINNPVFPFYMSAYSFGVIGIPLFGSVYGIENLGNISILGIANEFFLWFIYSTLIKQKLNNQKFDRSIIINFLKSPIIISIFVGLFFNVTSLENYIGDYVVYQGLLKAFTSVSSMATPIILIVIGAGISFEKEYVKKALQFVVFRVIVILGFGYIVKFFVIDMFYDVTNMFNLAYFTYLILPPPFALAIFVGQLSTEENTGIVNNATVISTLICVAAFITMVLVTT
jgi:predicted permease